MEKCQAISLDLQNFVQQVHTSLSQPTNDGSCTELLQSVVYMSSTREIQCPSNFMLSQLSRTDLRLARNEFHSQHYTNLLEFLVHKFSVEWMSLLPRGEGGSKLVDAIFLEGCPHSALIVLGESLRSASAGYCLNKCTDLLEQLLMSPLDELLWHQCQASSPHNADRLCWSSLVIILATLPDRVTAKHKNQTSAFFYPAQYIPHMCRSIYHCLDRVHDGIKQNQTCSLEFMGQLIGKLAITGYKDALWEQMLPPVECHLSSDFIWCRICERLISNVPDRCLESTVVPVIEQAAWYGTVVKFLGDSVLTNQKLRFLLTNKLLLVRHYRKHKILQNTLGYLGHSASTKHLLIKTLQTLLDVWGDASTLRHTSYEQHFYVSKAIVICLAFIPDKDKEALKGELLPKLMTGMQCHLESALPKIRHLGMAVAECLTATLDTDGDRLTFNYDPDDDTKELKQLLTKPTDPGPIKYTKITPRNTTSVEEITSSVTNIELTTKPQAGEELDSDDDLEPYDMSDDVKITKVKTPLYLRDCMEGLISSDEPDRIEGCIMAADMLIYKHHSSVKEISVEFTKVLLHLQDNYSIPGFLAARHRAMVALTYVAPAKVAEYLTNEFYERNYNIRQRIDILEVLSSAAQKLSNPSKTTSNSPESKTSLIQEINPEQSQPETWREIVDRRIESNTRRFSKGQQVAAPAESANQFAPVAGYFFFPLLQAFEKRHGTFDLLGDDHLLLSRLCYALGVIMYAAIHAPLVRQMSKALVEFIWTLRYHPQPAVRQALLFTMSMLLLAVPSHMLFTDLQAEMIETKTWLEDVIDKDTDNDCRQMALQTLVLITKALKQEFSSNDEGT